MICLLTRGLARLDSTIDGLIAFFYSSTLAWLSERGGLNRRAVTRVITWTTRWLDENFGLRRQKSVGKS